MPADPQAQQQGGSRLRHKEKSFDADHKRLNNGDILTIAAVSKRSTIVLRHEISQSTDMIDKTRGGTGERSTHTADIAEFDR